MIGWQCPRCWACYAPQTPCCWVCRPRTIPMGHTPQPLWQPPAEQKK